MTMSATPEDHPLLRRYQQHLRRIASLPELIMRQAMTRELLATLPEEEVVWWIDQLIRGALWGRQDAMDAMLAMSTWLMALQREDDYERVQGLFRAAHAERREAVMAVLRALPPQRALADGARLPEVRLPLSREVTLGERRAMAAGQDRRLLERLLQDPEPLVLTKLLDNPHIQADDLLSVAARRPTRPELLEALTIHPRWIVHLPLREALVRNPYGQTGLSLKLLPTLPLPMLRQVRLATDLHPTLPQLAALLITLREERTAPLRV